ncbi:MAG: phosphatidylserine decarboxylase family protein [Syntrophus sp. (in: bacteria)]|nr:phosphatidylserine decarboxylase family protein [Syntrophus sp. (in: bacteria)]
MNQKHDSIIAREGYIFIVVSGLFTLVAFAFALLWAALPLLLITLFIVWFFRNPERRAPAGENLVISPADGKVIKIEDVRDHEMMEGLYKKVSVFMNVFSVHVNRVPYAGRIETIRYYEGKFISANLDKASSDNERNGLVIRLKDGRAIGMIQIAGLVARRIVCWVNEGMMVEKGERFGLIRFGSRVDVFLPPDTIVLVKLGDKVRAGETPIGGLS